MKTHSLTFYLCIGIHLLFVCIAHAQWERMTVAEGGTVTSLAVLGDHVFAGTSGGIFISADSGVSWNKMIKTESNQTLRPLHFAIFGNTIIAAEETRCFTSADTGRTWSCTGQKRPIVAGYLSAFAINHGGYYYGTQDSGVYKSTDKGSTWKVANNGLTHLQITTLRAIDSMVFAGTRNGSLFRSTDDCSSWVEVSVGLKTELLESVSCLAAGEGRIFLGICNQASGPDGKVYCSIDNCASWQTFGDTLNEGVLSLHVNNGSVFAGTAQGCIYRSSVSSPEWVACATNVPNETRITASSFSECGGTILAASSFGVLRSVDEGITWSLSNHGMYLREIACLTGRNGSIFVGVAGLGIYRSDDNGSTWSPFNTVLKNNYLIYTFAQTSQMLFVYTSDGLYRTTDNGLHWSGTGSSYFSLYSGVQSIAAKDAIVFAGSRDSGVFISKDDGKSWARSNSGMGNLKVLSLGVGGNDVYAIARSTWGYDGQCFRSDDDGKHWTETEFPSTNMGTVVIDGDTTVFTGSSSGINSSSDRGESWQQKNICPDSGGPNYLAVFDSSIVVMNKCGLFHSVDRGAHWEKIDEPLSSDVISLTAGNNCLFAGTVSEGLWKRRFEGLTLSSAPRTAGNDLKNGRFNVQVGSLPNHVVSISVINSESTGFSVSVSNLTGALLMKTTVEKCENGLYRILWNARNNSAGSYLVRIQSGSYSIARFFTLLD